MSNFIRSDQSGIRATEVLGAKLGNFVSRDVEDFEARQHELKTGEILMRSWESEAEYLERKAKWGEQHPQKVAPGFVCDPAVADRELKRLTRTYGRPIPANATEATKDIFVEKHALMNRYREVLGLDPIDYNQTPDEEVTLTIEEKFSIFSERYSAAERRALIADANHLDFVRLVATKDPDQKVRDAAETRLSQLSIRTGKKKG